MSDKDFLKFNNKQLSFSEFQQKLGKISEKDKQNLSKLLNIFDSDKNGLIETNNSNGVNEVKNLWDALKNAATKNKSGSNNELDSTELNIFGKEYLKGIDNAQNILTNFANIIFKKEEHIQTTETSNFKNNIELTEIQAQNQVINTILDDVKTAGTLYFQQDNGKVSDAYDKLKEKDILGDKNLSATKVEEALALQEQTALNLISARDGELTKKEYYLQNKEHLKTMLLRRLYEKDENTGLNFLDRNKGTRSKEEFAKFLEDYIEDKVNSIQEIDSIKTMQSRLISLEKGEMEKYLLNLLDSANNEKPKFQGIESRFSIDETIPPEFNSDDPITFEEVFKYERGLEYSKEKVEQLISKTQERQMSIGAFNKFQVYKNGVNKLLKESNSLTSDKIIEFYQAYYENPMDDNLAKVKLSGLISKSKLPISLIETENGKFNIDLSAISNEENKQHALVNLLKLGLQEQEKLAVEVLGGNPEDRILAINQDYQTAYNSAYGSDFTEEIVKAMAEDNKTFIQKYTGEASASGMVLIGLGAALCCTPLAPAGGVILASGNALALGGMIAESGLGTYEAKTRDKVDEAELEDLKKTAIMNAGGFIVGFGAGKLGMKVFNKLVDKKLATLFKDKLSNIGRKEALKEVFTNPEMLKNFATAGGAKLSTDFLISYAGDLVMMGILDPKDDWKSLLQSNLMGIMVGSASDIADVGKLAGNKKVRVNNSDARVENDKTLDMQINHINKSDDEIAFVKTKTLKEMSDGELIEKYETLQSKSSNSPELAEGELIKVRQELAQRGLYNNGKVIPSKIDLESLPKFKSTEESFRECLKELGLSDNEISQCNLTNVDAHRLINYSIMKLKIESPEEFHSYLGNDEFKSEVIDITHQSKEKIWEDAKERKEISQYVYDDVSMKKMSELTRELLKGMSNVDTMGEFELFNLFSRIELPINEIFEYTPRLTNLLDDNYSEWDIDSLLREIKDWTPEERSRITDDNIRTIKEINSQLNDKAFIKLEIGSLKPMGDLSQISTDVRKNFVEQANVLSEKVSIRNYDKELSMQERISQMEAVNNMVDKYGFKLRTEKSYLGYNLTSLYKLATTRTDEELKKLKKLFDNLNDADDNSVKSSFLEAVTENKDFPLDIAVVDMYNYIFGENIKGDYSKFVDVLIKLNKEGFSDFESMNQLIHQDNFYYKGFYDVPSRDYKGAVEAVRAFIELFEHPNLYNMLNNPDANFKSLCEACEYIKENNIKLDDNNQYFMSVANNPKDYIVRLHKIMDKFNSNDIREISESNLEIAEIMVNKNLTKDYILTSILGDIRTKEQVELIKLFLSKEKLYNNPNLTSYFGDILYNTRTEEEYKIKMGLLDKYASEEKYYNNPNVASNLGYILRNTQTSEQLTLVNKFLSEEKLFNNQNVANNFGDILYNTRTEEEYKVKTDLLDKYASDEKYYNNSNVANNFGDILKVVNNENRLLTETLLYDTDFPKGNIVPILRSTDKDNEALVIVLCKDRNLKYSPDKIVNILTITKVFNVDIKQLSLSQKINAFEIISAMDKTLLNLCRQYSSVDIDAKITELKVSLGKKKDVISIPASQQQMFVQNILANNNKNAETVLKNFDFEQYGKQGLPLKYTREQFTANIENLIKDLSPEEQQAVLEHFGLIKGAAGFDGLPTNKPFNNENASPKTKEIAQKIQEEIETFTVKNQINTGDVVVDNVLNGLICGLPEFTSIAGKKQHGTHAYSVDIHTLKVLQSAMNNPLYENLSDSDKTILKIATLCHDLGKRGGVVDTGHANLSAEYVVAILEKFTFPQGMKDRIIDIVDNHHWFEAYNTGKATAEDVAVRCRRPEDFVIYEILAKADFENVNKDFHLSRSQGVNSQGEFDKYMQDKMEAIDKTLTLMYSNANLVFDTQFVRNGEMFPRQTIELDGVPAELKVLNLNDLKNDESLQKYGFSTGVIKDNARFTVHMTDPNEASMESVMILTQNSLNQSAWSTSLVKASNNRTYCNRKFGFVLDVDQANISEAYYANTSSGCGKGIETFKNLLFSKNGRERTYVKDNLIKELSKKGVELNDNEYSQLVRFLITKKYTTQITKDLKIGDKIIKAKDLVECLEKSRDALFEGGDIHSEIVPINPRVKGLIAKVEKLEDCPTEFLNFAKTHNLPIILMRPSKE